MRGRPAALACCRKMSEYVSGLILTALTSYALDAVERLHAMMTDPLSTQSTVVRAATAILAEARAYRDIDLDLRLTELEGVSRGGGLRAV